MGKSMLWLGADGPVGLVLLGALALFSACHHGDAADAARQWRAEHEARVRAMRAATASTPRGRAIEGEALLALVSDHTHEFRYERKLSGRPGPFELEHYFRPDGRFVVTDNDLALDPAGRADDRWRVDGARLCVVDSGITPAEQCFTLAVLADGRVQYFIDAPGTDAHGLLTKVTDAVHAGGPPEWKP